MISMVLMHSVFGDGLVPVIGYVGCGSIPVDHFVCAVAMVESGGDPVKIFSHVLILKAVQR